MELREKKRPAYNDDEQQPRKSPAQQSSSALKSSISHPRQLSAKKKVLIDESVEQQRGPADNDDEQQPRKSPAQQSSSALKSSTSHPRQLSAKKKVLIDESVEQQRSAFVWVLDPVGVDPQRFSYKSDHTMYDIKENMINSNTGLPSLKGMSLSSFYIAARKGERTGRVNLELLVDQAVVLYGNSSSQPFTVETSASANSTSGANGPSQKQEGGDVAAAAVARSVTPTARPSLWQQQPEVTVKSEPIPASQPHLDLNTTSTAVKEETDEFANRSSGRSQPRTHTSSTSSSSVAAPAMPVRVLPGLWMSGMSVKEAIALDSDEEENRRPLSLEGTVEPEDIHNLYPSVRPIANKPTLQSRARTLSKESKSINMLSYRTIRLASNLSSSGNKKCFHKSGFQRSLYEEPVVKAPSKWRKVAKYTLIVAATGATSFLVAGAYSLYISILARKYVTREDMHGYRAMDRNMLVDYSMDEMEEELLDCAIDVDDQIIELMEEREPTTSEELNQSYSNAACDETKGLLKAAIFGDEKERRRAWNDHYSFYYTYIELDELYKLREDGYEWGTAEEQRRWR